MIWLLNKCNKLRSILILLMQICSYIYYIFLYISLHWMKKIYECLFSVQSIGCFRCTSMNGNNIDCEDTFNNTDKYYVSDCWASRKDRIGLFPATECIKMTVSDGNLLVFFSTAFCLLSLGSDSDTLKRRGASRGSSEKGWSTRKLFASFCQFYKWKWQNFPIKRVANPLHPNGSALIASKLFTFEKSL